MTRPIRILTVVAALVAAVAGGTPTSDAATNAPRAAVVSTPAGGTWIGLADPSLIFNSLVRPGETRRITVGAVPVDATAWLTVEVRNPTAAGTLTAYTAGTPAPAVPTIAFAAGQNATTTTLVRMSSQRTLALRNPSSATVLTQIQLSGYYAPGTPDAAGAFAPTTPFAAARGITIPGHGAADITVAGVGGVPATADVVALGLAASTSTGAGRLVAYPRGAAPPDFISLALSAGRPAASTTLVRVGTSGQVTVANTAATPVTLGALTLGYFLAGAPTLAGALVKKAPAVLVDTATGVNAPMAPVAPHATLSVPVPGRAGVPAAGADTVVVSLSATSATASGSLTAYRPDAQFLPTTPSLRFSPGRTTSALAVVALSKDNRIAVRNNSSGTVQVRADIVGYYGFASGFSWGAPTRVSTDGPPDLTTVSCPTTSFCMSLDADGTSLRFNGSGWTRTLRAVPPGTYAVSCTSASFCLAVAPGRFAQRWDGSAWRATQAAPGAFLSCTSPTFCLAADDTSYKVWNGTSFGTQRLALPRTRMVGLSCSGATNCIGLFSPTYAEIYWARFDGQRWASNDTPLPNLSYAASLSCTGSFCLAIDSDSAATFDGTTWTHVQSQPFSAFIGGVSCRSATFCAAIGSDGSIDGYATAALATFDGSSWSHERTLFENGRGHHVGVSCASTTSCVGVTDGLTSRFSGSAWSAPAVIDPDAGTALDDVSCASASFCVATEANAARVWNGAAWAAPTAIGTPFNPAGLGEYSSRISDVSCVSSTFCIASIAGGEDISTGGGWAVYNGTSWAVDDQRFSPQQLSVSCVSSSFCVSLSYNYYAARRSDSAYAASVFDGTSWRQSNSFSELLDNVSCVSTTFCLAVGQSTDQRKAWSRWNGTSWSDVATFGDTAGSVQDVGCLSATRCFAVDDQGRVFTFDGTAWTTTSVTSKALTNISCRVGAACIAVGPNVSAVQYLGRGAWSAPFSVRSFGDTRAISCPTARFCLATDAVGYATTGRA